MSDGCTLYFSVNKNITYDCRQVSLSQTNNELFNLWIANGNPTSTTTHVTFTLDVEDINYNIFLMPKLLFVLEVLNKFWLLSINGMSSTLKPGHIITLELKGTLSELCSVENNIFKTDNLDTKTLSRFEYLLSL